MYLYLYYSFIKDILHSDPPTPTVTHNIGDDLVS